ncbi:MAG: DegT/DnrJ/EryC1/StrS family aminotransferase [Deltaproteobacteria bacterium]|nr:DegT/DnrJ/EryC1/StrS family aminotransferase [Deltaproteobacteria bacterium]
MKIKRSFSEERRELIPVNEPSLSEREKELLIQCVDSGWISSEGPFVRLFEEVFAGFVGVNYGVAVSNGTVALEMAIAALELEPGDEVIMPTFTIVSCAIAVIRNGLRPVLVDSEIETWNMNVNQVAEKISPRTKAIMPVHIYGHPVDMDPLLELAEQYGLYIIEDAAEVHGAEYKERKCGSIGHMGVFSFYANKIVTTGEGGMIVTNDRHLAARFRLLRNLCFQPERRFEHQELGYNFRMTNLQAAVGVAQMERADELVRRKIWQGGEYRKKLKRIDGVKLQGVKPWARPVYWVNGIVLDSDVPMDAFEFANRLSKKGIQTRPFFWPMHEQPIFQKSGLFRNERYPVSEKLARRGLYLPSGMALTAAQIDKVCEAVKETLAEVGR